MACRCRCSCSRISTTRSPQSHMHNSILYRSDEALICGFHDMHTRTYNSIVSSRLIDWHLLRCIEMRLHAECTLLSGRRCYYYTPFSQWSEFHMEHIDIATHTEIVQFHSIWSTTASHTVHNSQLWQNANERAASCARERILHTEL